MNDEIPDILMPAYRPYSTKMVPSVWFDYDETIKIFERLEEAHRSGLNLKAKDKFIKQLEAENAELIEMLKQVYLADDEGSSQFIELQQKVSDCLFNNMGWAGDENKFANWQESVVDDLTDPTQSIGVDDGR